MILHKDLVVYTVISKNPNSICYYLLEEIYRNRNEFCQVRVYMNVLITNDRSFVSLIKRYLKTN